MTKLTIKGYAEREVAYDTMVIRIKFYSQGNSTEIALKEVKIQSEKFLELITGMGIDVGEIELEDTSVDKDYMSNRSISAKRVFKLTLKINIPILNAVLDLIKENDFSATVNTEFSLRDNEQIHRELIIEALEASRRKAELIAVAMNACVVRSESIEVVDRNCVLDDVVCPPAGCPSGAGEKLFDKLKTPTTVERETIDVVWIVE